MILYRKPNKSPKNDFSWVFTARVTFNKNVCETVCIMHSVGGNALQVTKLCNYFFQVTSRALQLPKIQLLGFLLLKINKQAQLR